MKEFVGKINRGSIPNLKNEISSFFCTVLGFFLKCCQYLPNYTLYVPFGSLSEFLMYKIKLIDRKKSRKNHSKAKISVNLEVHKFMIPLKNI